MIIDGKRMASEVLARAKARARNLPHLPRVLALVTSETPATKSYLSIKSKRAADAGCVLEIRQFPESVSIEELQNAITDSDADAIIVQLPLPVGVNTKEVCDTIPVEKDADVLSSEARAKFERGDTNAFLPPVVAAIAHILRTENVELKEKRAVVVGNGFLVGAPSAMWLAQQGAHVTVVNNSTTDYIDILKQAEIIVSGAGSPHLIKPEMLKEGIVLVDAGTTESNGIIVGDADPACAAKCSIFTPVPGGVGPLAVACLFENAVVLAQHQI